MQDFGATSFDDYTAEINEIIEGVNNISDIKDCCDYEYQILDKFCAVQPAVSIESNMPCNTCITS